MSRVTRLPVRDADEPAVRNPELGRLVELARRQPPPRLTLDSERIHAVWLERRAQRRRKLGVLAAAALVGLVAASIYRSVEQKVESADVVVIDEAPRPEIHAPIEDSLQGSSVTPVEPAKPVLAAGVRIEPQSADAAHTVLGPWRVDVAAGVYEVAAPVEAVSSLHVRVGDRTLVIEPGGMVRIHAGARPEVDLLAGEAAWIDREGRRIDLPAALDDGLSMRRADAAALARKAERQMAAGDRKGAIATYRILVRKHPRSSAARAGLLDLARLLKANGDTNGARCAYTLVLERWPNNHLRPEIERALQSLGPGPKCTDL
jgi:hypothetical protein